MATDPSDNAMRPTVDPSASPFALQETEALPLTKKERQALREFIEESNRERATLATGVSGRLRA